MLFGRLDRREFIGLLGSAAVWPLVARAQQSSKPIVGFLASRSPEDSANVLPIFRQALSQGGYVEDQSVTIEYQWGRGRYDRLPALAAGLVNDNVAVIVAFGPPAALAAKNATEVIPIVFVSGGDPVAIGLVNSLSHPGGNVTGVNLFNSELGSKRLALLAELVPSASMIAFLVNPKNPDAEIETGDALRAGRALGRQGFIVNASNEQEIEKAFATIAQRHAGALFVGVDPFFNFRRDKIVSMAARHGIPAIYQFRDFADAGGLISYGTSLADAYRQAGNYVARILAGTEPAALPVFQATKFELVINLKTAQALGITIPASLLARADDVIE